jgi:hypothetical protein
LINSSITTKDQVEGCSLEEVLEVRRYANGHLPGLYEKFLLAMGHGAGKFFLGTDIFYPEVLTNREGASDLLREDSSLFELSESDFVFAIHQGYQFMYFKIKETDDPAVFFYLEGSGVPQKKYDRFSEFLLKAVEDYETKPLL